MFRGSGVLSELLCPRNDCDRVHCRFFHEGRSESHSIGDGCLDTPPFPCEPQDYKFAFPSGTGTDEADPNVSSYVPPESSPISPCPYRIPGGSSTIGDVQRDLSRVCSISDFGYLPHIPSAPVHGPSVQPFNPFETSSYNSYHVQSSKYAPEEPGVVSSDSFSGYAPAPSPSSSTHAIYAPTPLPTNLSESVSYSNSGVEYVEKSLPNQVTKEEPSVASQTTRVSDGLKQEPLSADSHIKTSTAKKIKTLPLPRVPIPPATKSKSEQFKEYVGEVARLNEEIERLQRLQEQLKQEAKKIAGSSGEIPSSVVQSTQELLERSCSSQDPTELAESNRCVRKTAPPRERPQVIEYTPTPLADLERMKEEELKRKKQKDGKKREATKDCGRTEHAKRRPLSEDEMSLLFGDDEVEPKAKKARNEAPILTMKSGNRKAKPEVSSSQSTDATHKDSHPSNSTKARDSKLSVGCESPRNSTATVSSSVTKPKELSPDVVAAAKKRIAREKAEERRAMVAAPARKLPSVREQLHARMAAVAKEKSATPTSSKTMTNMKPMTQEQMYGHRAGTTIGSIAKGEARTARSANATNNHSDGGMPKLRDPTNQKIPYSVRVTFLKRIFDQYLEVCPRVEAIRNSEIEEKAIVDKVRHAQSYKVAVINLIGRIRNAKSTGLGKTKAALSHDAVLAGRHVNDISVRVRKSSKNSSPSLTEKEFYNVLINKYLMTEEQLIRNGYPRAVPGEERLVSIAQSHFEISKAQKSWAAKDDLDRLCSRCHKEFRLDPKGKVVPAECIYHYKSLQRRGGMRGESYFACCGADRTTPGCCVAEAHVSDTLNAEALREFTPTPASQGEDDPRNYKVYAMDCEMVYGVWGPELARVSVVDMDNKLVLDLIVKPHNTIIDYNTRFSGLTANQVETSNVDLFEAQNRLFELVNERSILIGHSLESDLKAMRLRHERVVDTAVVFEHRQGFPFKRALRNLASEYLQKIIQEDDAGHDSQEDSATCMSLMLLKVKDECK